jgi:hypothetical protein
MQTYAAHPKRLKAVQKIIGHAVNIKPERDNLMHGNIGSSGIFFKLRDGKTIDISDTAGTPAHLEDLACGISDISAEVFRHQKALEGLCETAP